MTEPHAKDAPTRGPATANVHNEAAGHGDSHVSDGHGHGPGAEPLGPIDVAAWGAGLAGIGVAIVIAACLVLATSGIG
jgi:hypothetical protein